MRVLFLITFSILSFTLPITNYAQCMMAPLSLNKRVVNASTIIQGKVIHISSYISVNNKIFTSNLVQVNAYLKGPSTHKYIIVISEGGIVGDRAEIVHPALELDMSHEIVLLLMGDNTKIDNKFYRLSYPGIPQMETYGCSQGKFTYQDGLYYDLLSESPLSEAGLFKKINRVSGLIAITPEGKRYVPRIHSFPSNSKTKPGIAKIAAISGVSPNPGIAGTINVSDQLTISGSGFGAAPGTVEFSNADDGGATFVPFTNASDIISWADAQIVLKVPQGAGTGTVRVNGTFTSPYTVTYSHVELNNNFAGFASTTRQRAFLVNKDGSGGYALQYNTTFAANTAAVAAFERALQTWRCNTFVNFSISPTTTAISVAANDGTNVVSFDPLLPAGVLGRATSRFGAASNGGCQMQNTVWRTTEIDIQFQDPPSVGFTWNYGPTASIAFGSTYDFESVALHELGHAHGLGHIIASGNVMHYSLFNGADVRVLSASSDIAGGVAKMGYSTVAANYCIQYPAGVVGPMTALTAGSCALPVSLLSFTGKRIEPNHNLLKWVTADESDNSGFELGRSYDGINFSVISYLNAQTGALTQKNYTYHDYTAENKGYTYYKLIQVDIDGHRTSFPILQIEALDITSATINFDPGDKIIYIQFSKPIETDTEWNLYNATGQVVAKEKILKGTSQNLYYAPNLSNGIYTYSILGTSINSRGKMILQQVW